MNSLVVNSSFSLVALGRDMVHMYDGLWYPGGNRKRLILVENPFLGKICNVSNTPERWRKQKLPFQLS